MAEKESGGSPKSSSSLKSSSSPKFGGSSKFGSVPTRAEVDAQLRKSTVSAVKRPQSDKRPQSGKHPQPDTHPQSDRNPQSGKHPQSGRYPQADRHPQLDTKFLSTTELFRGTTPEEITAMMGCLGSSVHHFDKGEYVFVEGSTTHSLGIVLEGSVRSETSDMWGNVRVMGQFGRGQTFGEAFAALGTEPLLVNVVAAEDCTVLFVDVRNVAGRCPRACAYHAQVNTNLLATIARKNVSITQRLRDAAPKSIRGKLMAYLSTQSKLAGSREFDIPFKRQQLADYLGVDRSALSSVISSLQREGVLETHRSHFKLLK